MSEYRRYQKVYSKAKMRWSPNPPISRGIIRSLSWFLTWMLCGLVITFYLKTSRANTLGSVSEHEPGPISASTSSLNKAEDVSINEERGEVTLSGWSHLLDTKTRMDDDTEQPQSNNRDFRPITNVHAEMLQRLVGDLETCVEDLMPYTFNQNVEKPATISGRSLRSCREAIAGFLLWIRERKSKSPQESTERVSADYSPSLKRRDSYTGSSPTALHTRTDGTQLVRETATVDSEVNGNQIDSSSADEINKKEGTQDSAYEQNKRLAPKGVVIEFPDRSEECQKSVCNIKNIEHTCSTERLKLKPSMLNTCEMCYPLDESRIESHCSREGRRERHSFYVLLAMILGGLATGVVIIFIHEKRKNAAESKELRSARIPQWTFINVVPPALELWKRHIRGIFVFLLQKLKPRSNWSDLERQKDDGSNGIYLEHVFNNQKPWDALDDTESQVLGAAMGVRLKKPQLSKLRNSGTNSNSETERVPASPRARSSSVQYSASETPAITVSAPREAVDGDSPNQQHTEIIQAATPTRISSANRQKTTSSDR